MARDFENAKTQKGIHYSRYIASWMRMGGKIYPEGLFYKWLREVEQLTEEEISDISLMTMTGKMELETSAKTFMKKHNGEFQTEKYDPYPQCL